MNHKPKKAVAGQIRQWAFIRSPTDNVTITSREGKCFLVVGVDGVRCDTMQEGGSAESFYLDWMVHNSETVES